jgi:hypothetical protein
MRLQVGRSGRAAKIMVDEALPETACQIGTVNGFFANRQG